MLIIVVYGQKKTDFEKYIESKGFLASLTFGGYDSSRIIPNNVPFFLAPDISRDLVVGLQSITSTRADGSAVSLLSSKILTFIDSTLPYIIVSQETCLAFENVFGLMWNTSLDLYVVNDTLHHNLITHNPSFTFRIADSTNRGPTVDIVMPYASFDLSIDHPLLPDNTNYFPLKCAQNSSQYTLGRTFLQEAYVWLHRSLSSKIDCRLLAISSLITSTPTFPFPKLDSKRGSGRT